tara:strand:- start:24591 stop:26432 length:1842 start_codon:yes stop_codon:yes gene_type:complete
MSFSDFFDINQYAKFFRVGRMKDDLREREAMFNSQGLSQEQLDMGLMTPSDSTNFDAQSYGGYMNGITSINIQFDQYFANKAQRVSTYREMAKFPEISDAIDIICDDAICETSKGDYVQLDIKEELPSHIDEELRKIWKYLLDDVFSFSETAWDFFRKWLIDGELYVELILNNEGDNIIGIKGLPPHTMIPVYLDSTIVEFIQTVKPVNIDAGQGYGAPPAEDENVVFDKDQVVYTNYGDTGRNRYDNRGFLEASIRTYNQLRNLEDAVVIYRLVRAPERRLWNINVGRMNKTRAEEYLRGIMQRYRKKFKYDTQTGAMDSAQNVQAMTEDFWFPKNADGEGTTVDVLGAGQNLGEMDDVEYFLKKLYKTLKLPSSRWGDVDGSNIYSTGKSGEITREEIKFSRFIERLQKNFKYLLLDPFITLLRLRNIDRRYIDYSLYNVIFTETNVFKEYKELELLESRFALLGSIDAYIYKPEENENGYFSKDFVLREWFKMTDVEYQMNKELLEKEKKSRAAEIEAAGFNQPDAGAEGEDGGFGGGQDAGGGAGGGFGGGDVGGGEFQAGADEDEGFGGEAADVVDQEVPTEEGFTITNVNSTILNEFVESDKKIIKE